MQTLGSGCSGARAIAQFLKSMLVIAICLMLVFTILLAGCTGVQSSAKQVPDTRPGKEGQKIEVREELPWHCKAFWGTMGVLSWFFPGDRSTFGNPEEQRAKSAQETSRFVEKMNREYLDKGTQKKPQ
jgi:hypothetical protein